MGGASRRADCVVPPGLWLFKKCRKPRVALRFTRGYKYFVPPALFSVVPPGLWLLKKSRKPRVETRGYKYFLRQAQDAYGTFFCRPSGGVGLEAPTYAGENFEFSLRVEKLSYIERYDNRHLFQGEHIMHKFMKKIMSINRAHTKGTYCYKTTGEISLETPQFMKHKCVFGLSGLVLERNYAFGMHKRASGSQTEVCAVSGKPAKMAWDRGGVHEHEKNTHDHDTSTRSGQAFKMERIK